LAANSVDSDQYVDGSIDNAHLAANSVDSDQYVDGSIDNAHLAANSVDSDQYVDGSIDNAHLADDAVNSDELAAGSVDIAHLSATGTAGSGNYLRGDNSWQSAGGGKLLQLVAAQHTSFTNASSGNWFTTGLTCAITPTTIGNKIHAIFTGQVGGYADNYPARLGVAACIGLAGLDSGSGFSTAGNPASDSDAFSDIHPQIYMYHYNLSTTGATFHRGLTLQGLHTTTSTAEVTYEVYISGAYGQAAVHWGAAVGRGYGPGILTLMEIES
jgi:hypothetical protein